MHAALGEPAERPSAAPRVCAVSSVLRPLGTEWTSRPTTIHRRFWTRPGRIRSGIGRRGLERIHRRTLRTSSYLSSGGRTRRWRHRVDRRTHPRRPGRRTSRTAPLLDAAALGRQRQPQPRQRGKQQTPTTRQPTLETGAAPWSTPAAPEVDPIGSTGHPAAPWETSPPPAASYVDHHADIPIPLEPPTRPRHVVTPPPDTDDGSAATVEPIT